MPVTPIYGSVSTVVISNLNLIGTSLRPSKADAVLIVDANTVLTPSVSLQGFQSIAPRDRQIVQSDRRIELVELPKCCVPK